MWPIVVAVFLSGSILNAADTSVRVPYCNEAHGKFCVHDWGPAPQRKCDPGEELTGRHADVCYKPTKVR